MEQPKNSHQMTEMMLASLFSVIILFEATDWFVRGHISLVSGISFIIVICLSFPPLRKFLKGKVPSLIPRKEFSIFLVFIFLGLAILFSV